MDTVTETAMAQAVEAAGGVGIIHRYTTIEEQAQMVTTVTKNDQRTGAAIGITGDFFERSQALVDAGASFLCLDVAHGHHTLMRSALHKLRNGFGDSLHLMAGNVATLESFSALADWGANSVRVGIGGGSICSTRIQTGHGMPTFSSIMGARGAQEGLAHQKKPRVSIVADGGIRTSGDIVKALAAGADFVMVGSLLAGTRQAPGEIIETATGKCKTYRGMASKDAQMDWRGRTSSVEGIATVIPYKGDASHVLRELERGIRSGFSYSGARNLTDLREKAQFIVQTGAGIQESATHILSR
jgi:IMP dehydrogenase